MHKQTNIGTFYQGQVIGITIATPANATASEKEIMKNNDLYIGLYGSLFPVKILFSTTDGTLIKSIDSSGGVTLACVISAKETKSMSGEYHMEVLIKNSNNTFTAPCENVLTFNIEKRKISEVIK